MRKLFVSTETSVYGEEHPQEQYGHWSRSADFSVRSVSIVKDPYTWGQKEVDVYFEPNIGDPVYVLSVTYTSGDSFGTSSGNGSVLAVFKNVGLAFDAKQNLEKNEGEYTLHFKMDDGTTQDVSNPVSGYFENLTHISVEQFSITA